MTYSFALASTTDRGVLCAEALLSSGWFQLAWVLTPQPKPVGRKKTLTPNPVDGWAESQNVPKVLIEKKLDHSVKNQVAPLPTVDFLLVVDFGYLVPSWLLELPEVAPVNVHPSALPSWRGSSPGQFSLLYGEKTSASTIMIMSEGLDEGPILTQVPFDVDPNWTQTGYYARGFELAAEVLPDTLKKLAAGQLQPTPQPTDSPTPIARQLRKSDAFVDWQLLASVIAGSQPKDVGGTSQLLCSLAENTPWPTVLEQASRAFSPWPVLWTELPTAKGLRRMKIISAEVVSETELRLNQVQIAGQEPAQWNQVKNMVVK